MARSWSGSSRHRTATPGGRSRGRFDGVLATGTITAADLVAPLAGHPLSDLVAAIQSGHAYVNVHTNDGVAPTNTGPGDFPGGEIPRAAPQLGPLVPATSPPPRTTESLPNRAGSPSSSRSSVGERSHPGASARAQAARPIAAHCAHAGDRVEASPPGRRRTPGPRAASGCRCSRTAHLRNCPSVELSGQDRVRVPERVDQAGSSPASTSSWTPWASMPAAKKTRSTP